MMRRIFVIWMTYNKKLHSAQQNTMNRTRWEVLQFRQQAKNSQRVHPSQVQWYNHWEYCRRFIRFSSDHAEEKQEVFNHGTFTQYKKRCNHPLSGMPELSKKQKALSYYYIWNNYGFYIFLLRSIHCKVILFLSKW